jgi:hypothetical protein
VAEDGKDRDRDMDRVEWNEDSGLWGDISFVSNESENQKPKSKSKGIQEKRPKSRTRNPMTAPLRSARRQLNLSSSDSSPNLSEPKTPTIPKKGFGPKISESVKMIKIRGKEMDLKTPAKETGKGKGKAEEMRIPVKVKAKARVEEAKTPRRSIQKRKCSTEAKIRVQNMVRDETPSSSPSPSPPLKRRAFLSLSEPKKRRVSKKITDPWDKALNKNPDFVKWLDDQNKLMEKVDSTRLSIIPQNYFY